jgi:hypothetical protein
LKIIEAIIEGLRLHHNQKQLKEVKEELEEKHKTEIDETNHVNPWNNLANLWCPTCSLDHPLTTSGKSSLLGTWFYLVL